jgi:hypothetical protein
MQEERKTPEMRAQMTDIERQRDSPLAKAFGVASNFYV